MQCIISLFDTAVNGHLLEQGVLDLKLGKTVFLVVETGCQYFKELAFPDIITAGIKVSKLGTSSVTYAVGLFSGKENFAAAQGHFVHVNVNRRTRRPSEISSETIKYLTSLM